MPLALTALVIAKAVGAITAPAAEAVPDPAVVTARTLTWEVTPGVRPVIVSGEAVAAGFIACHVAPLSKLTS